MRKMRAVLALTLISTGAAARGRALLGAAARQRLARRARCSGGAAYLRLRSRRGRWRRQALRPEPLRRGPAPATGGRRGGDAASIFQNYMVCKEVQSWVVGNAGKLLCAPVRWEVLRKTACAIVMLRAHSAGACGQSTVSCWTGLTIISSTS